MGVSSTTNRTTYTGDGMTLTFSFPYYFFNQVDLVVYKYDTILGGITPLTLNNQYTVTGTANAQGLYPNGGSVVFGAAPLSTDMVTITRAPARTQTYNLLQNGQISSTALVQQMDYMTLLIQRLQDQVSRCVAIPDGFAPTYNPVLPATLGLASNELGFLQNNAAASGIQLSTAGNVVPVVVDYTAFQTAGLTNQVAVITLPPGGVLTSIFVKHTTAFAGTSITALPCSIGIVSDYSKFISGFDLLGTVSDTAFDSIMANYLGSWANTTTIYIQAVATGANLSALTQGSVNVYYTTMLA